MSYASYKYGLNPDENSYLYGDSESEPEDYLGASSSSGPLNEHIDPNGSVNVGSMAGTAASGAAMGGPVGAGIAVGGQFLSQYLAQKAADERQRKKQDVENARKYGDDQNQSLGTLLSVYKGALR